MKKEAANGIKIDHDIPIPPRPLTTGLADVIRSMKIGESFIAPKGMESSNAHTYAHYADAKVTTRKQSDGTYRVWRIK